LCFETLGIDPDVHKMLKDLENKLIDILYPDTFQPVTLTSLQGIRFTLTAF